MATIRVRYIVTAKHETLQPHQQIGPLGITMEMKVKHGVNFDNTDQAKEEELYHALEVGKEYFCDWTPVDEATDWMKSIIESPEEEEHGEARA